MRIPAYIAAPNGAASRGAAARAAGAAFERELESVHRVYALQGVAKMFFVYPPTASAGSRERPHLRVVKGRSEPDYRGWLCRPLGLYRKGAAIVMEAKRTNQQASLPVRRKGAGLHWDQAGHLLTAVDDGCLAAVVWRNGPRVGVLAGRALARALALPGASSFPTRIPWPSFAPLDGGDPAGWIPAAASAE